MLANIGSNLSYTGTGLQNGVARTPIDDPNNDVPTLPDQSNLRTKDFACRRRSGWDWPTT